MKKFLLFTFSIILGVCSANAYQKVSENEYGIGDARNQNIVVKCTTTTGQISNETCTLRRYAKCQNNRCSDWNKWRELRNTSDTYSDWQSGATACCRAKGLR